MNRALLAVPLALLALACPAIAGHRHGCAGYQQAPVYAAPPVYQAPVYAAPPVYQAPVYAAPQTYQAPQAPVVVMQQEAPRDLARDLLPLILELSRGGRVSEGGTTVVRDSDTRSELAALKSELESLRKETDEGFENVASILTRHGKEIVELRLDVKEIAEGIRTGKMPKPATAKVKDEETETAEEKKEKTDKTDAEPTELEAEVQSLRYGLQAIGARMAATTATGDAEKAARAATAARAAKAAATTNKTTKQTALTTAEKAMPQVPATITAAKAALATAVAAEKAAMTKAAAADKYAKAKSAEAVTADEWAKTAEERVAKED